MRRVTSLLLPVAVLSPIAAAAETSSAMETTLVTATRTAQALQAIPFTVDIIDQQALRAQIAVSNDLTAALGNEVPSFSPSRRKMSGAGETLRGREPLYLIDGVPQSTPLRDGSRDGHIIDPLVVERIEVINGANAIQGLGAPGGVINIVTLKPSDEFEQAISTRLSSPTDSTHDTLSWKVGYRASGKFGPGDVIAAVSRETNGMMIDGHGDYVGVSPAQGDIQDTVADNFFITLGLDIDEDQRLQLMLNHYDMEGNGDWDVVPGNRAAGVPTSAVERTVAGDPPRNETSTYSLDYSHDDLLGHRIFAQLFHQKFDATFGGGAFASFQDPAFGSQVFDQSQVQASKDGLKLTAITGDLARHGLSLAYGIDIYEDTTEQALIQTGRSWVPEIIYKNQAPFAQLSVQPIDLLTLNAGIRHERAQVEIPTFTTIYSNNGGQTVQGGEPEFSENLFNAGAVFELGDSLRAYVNYAEGFSMADIGRILRGVNQPGLNVENLLDIEPVITENREIGLDGDFGAWSFNIAVYRSESDLGSILIPDADGIYSVERRASRIDGIDLSSEWQLSEAAVVGLNAAYIEGDEDTTGNGVPDSPLSGRNIPPHRINLFWTQQWLPAVMTRLQVNHYLDRDEFSGADAHQNFDGYTTADLLAVITTRDLGEFAIGLENIGDVFYIDYFSQTNPAPVSTTEENYFAGPGRTLSVSWNYAF